jgi:hypothetical protein
LQGKGNIRLIKSQRQHSKNLIISCALTQFAPFDYKLLHSERI